MGRAFLRPFFMHGKYPCTKGIFKKEEQGIIGAGFFLLDKIGELRKRCVSYYDT